MLLIPSKYISRDASGNLPEVQFRDVAFRNVIWTLVNLLNRTLEMPTNGAICFDRNAYFIWSFHDIVNEKHA